ncbi:hypothetical protein Tco_0920147 [Tanacetum coccineum]
MVPATLRGDLSPWAESIAEPTTAEKMLDQFESLPEFGGASGSGGCGDDEPGGDEDGDEDEEDEEDVDS